MATANVIPFLDHGTARRRSWRYNRSIFSMPGTQIRRCMCSRDGIVIWLNKDPIEEKGGINLYAYVNNRPIAETDFFGLDGNSSTNRFDPSWLATTNPVITTSITNTVTIMVPGHAICWTWGENQPFKSAATAISNVSNAWPYQVTFVVPAATNFPPTNAQTISTPTNAAPTTLPPDMRPPGSVPTAPLTPTSPPIKTP